jgi:hypothetical protein
MDSDPWMTLVDCPVARRDIHTIGALGRRSTVAKKKAAKKATKKATKKKAKKK